MTTTAKPSFQDFLDWLEARRKEGQVVYGEQAQAWSVLGHPEVNQLLHDASVFSSDMTPVMPKGDDQPSLFSKGNFVQMDDPRHRYLRGGHHRSQKAESASHDFLCHRPQPDSAG